MPKESALQKIESHEKLCRIMQKQTHDKINGLQNQITRIRRASAEGSPGESVAARAKS